MAEQLPADVRERAARALYDPEVCRVHDEWWPCAAVRAGRPVAFPPATTENVLVVRPKREI